jgi:hypothetical protein
MAEIQPKSTLIKLKIMLKSYHTLMIQINHDGNIKIEQCWQFTQNRHVQASSLQATVDQIDAIQLKIMKFKIFHQIDLLHN